MAEPAFRRGCANKAFGTAECGLALFRPAKTLCARCQSMQASTPWAVMPIEALVTSYIAGVGRGGCSSGPAAPAPNWAKPPLSIQAARSCWVLASQRAWGDTRGKSRGAAGRELPLQRAIASRVICKADMFMALEEGESPALVADGNASWVESLVRILVLLSISHVCPNGFGGLPCSR